MKLYFIFLFLCIKYIKSEYSFQTKYTDVLIDHFSYTRNDTFKLKYLINDTFWSEGGPLFFYTGNEGDIELFAQNTGFMWDIAGQFKALLVFCEHRYYGTSMPFGNLSYSDPQYLGYLTSEQALEDFVDVINMFQKSKYASNGPLPVIAFGGSYGGMLSAWIRMKYPATVLGSIASSAPIWQFTGLTPCQVFNSIVTRVYSESVEGMDCSIPFKHFWPALRRVTNSADGKVWMQSAWKLCKNLTEDYDIQSFINDITNAMTNIAMANYPYPNQFLADLPGNPVKAICSQLKNYESYLNSDQMLIMSVGKALSIYSNYSGQAQCNDFSETSSLGDSGWDFQSCTEIVMPMCTDDNAMFESSVWDFEAYAQNCMENYGVRPPNPEEVVLKYGGKNIQYASNIVFTNGLLDPWSGGGVLKNITGTITFIIPDGAHHLDLRASNPADPPSVRGTRTSIINAIENWLIENEQS